MDKQTFPKSLFLGALGLLVFIFAVILILIASALIISHAPHTGGFVFAISRRSFIISGVTVFTAVAVVLLVFVRALRRRLN